MGTIRLYRRLGFVEEGRRAEEIKIGPNRYVDEVLMGRFVKLGLEKRTWRFHET